VNEVGGVAAQILMRAQRALNHAATLSLGQNTQQGLPLFANDPSEDLLAACAEASECEVPRLAEITKRCLATATRHHVRSTNVMEFLTPSISSYANAVSMNTSAEALLGTADLLNDSFTEKGGFAKDRVAGPYTKETTIALALAAAHASDVILANIQEADLWNIQCLN